MAASTPRRAIRRDPAASAWSVLAAVVLTVLGMHLVYRSYFLAGDDVLLVSRHHDRPGGHAPLGAVGHAFVDDWSRVNGRWVDACTMLLLSLGRGAMTWLLPAGIALLGLAAAAGAPRRRHPWLLAYLVGVAILPIATMLDQGMSGEVAVWAAGFGGYLVTTALATLALTLVGRADRLPRWAVVGAVPLLLAIQQLHEITTLALLAGALAIALLDRGGRRRTLLLGATALGGVVHLAAPGIWARTKTDAGQAAQGGLTPGNLQRVTSALAAHAWLPLLVLVALVGCRALLPVIGQPRRRAWLVAAVAALTLEAFALLPLLPDPRLLRSAIILTLLLGALGGLTVALRADGAARSVVLLWAAAGSCVLPLYLGSSGSRQWFPVTAFLWLACAAELALVTDRWLLITTEIARRACRALVGVAVLGLVVWSWVAGSALAQNYDNWQHIERNLAAASRGEAKVVRMIEMPAYPWVPNGWSWSMYRNPMRQYYQIPHDVLFVPGRND